MTIHNWLAVLVLAFCAAVGWSAGRTVWGVIDGFLQRRGTP